MSTPKVRENTKCKNWSKLATLAVQFFMASLPCRSHVDQEIRYGCILLAAGTGSRMAGLDKLFLEIDGQSLIEKSYRIYKDNALDPVIVTGFDHARLDPFIAQAQARSVHNPNFAQGQSTSVLTGLATLPGSDDAVIIALADMPLLDQNDVSALMSAYATRPDSCAVIVPTNGKQRGNPVILDAALVGLILQQGTGVRDYLDRHPHLIHWFTSTSPGYYVDIDCRKDLEMVRDVYGINVG